MDQSGPGGPRGPQPPLVDQEPSGPPWTTLRHFPDATPLTILLFAHFPPCCLPGRNFDGDQEQPPAQSRRSARPPPHALQSIMAGERSILSILRATVSGILDITTQLDTVTAQLSEVRKENQELRTNLHTPSSLVANESATHEDIRPVQSALRNLSHRVISAAPIARPMAPTAPTPPTAPPGRLPARSHPPLLGLHHVALLLPQPRPLVTPPRIHSPSPPTGPSMTHA